MTSAVTSVGSLLSITSSLSSVVGIAASFLVFHLGAQYIKTDGLTPVFYAYSGDLIALVLSQLAAAYAAVKTIDASVHTNTGFFYLMRGGSSMGDFMGLYELLATLAFLTWSLVISVVGYVEAAMLWQKYEDMEKNGVTKTQIHGYKFGFWGLLLVLVLGFQASPSETHALSSSDSSITTTPRLREPMIVLPQEPEIPMVPQSSMTSPITSLPPCTPTLLSQPSPYH